MIFLLVLVAFLHIAVEAEKPICLITVPNIVHLGVEETVSVQLHGATESASVKVFFRDPQGPKNLSESKIVNLNEENQYQDVVTLQIDPESFAALKGNNDPHVHFVAESSDVFSKSKMVHVSVSTRKGYIFIQTDKTIYNPGEHVKYRIFTLDNYLRPVNELINFQIFNSKDMLVYSHVLPSNQILQKTFTIPDVGLAGHWKITASFDNFPKSETSLKFEVREYVLPLFEVKFEAVEHYISMFKDDFSFSISARYTYGKGVNGKAYVRFGLIDSTGNNTYLPGIEKQIAVEDGRADVIVQINELRFAAASQNLEHLTNMYLYIAATVLETASGDVEEAESSSLKIVTSPYVIDLSRTKKYFTPGGMFSILGTTSFPDGTRVPNLFIKAAVTIDGKTQIKESAGDNNGNIAIKFLVKQSAKQMSITVQAQGDDKEIMSDATITSTAIAETDGSYLSVEVPHQILNPGQSLRVTFRDITTSGAATAGPSHIYYLIVSKGRVLKAGRVQRTPLTSMNLPFSVDMVPAFRLVAYYYTQANNIVADSVWVDVKDVCQGKVEIVPFSEHKPGRAVQVSVRTDLDSKVALSAVDSAVYILNKKGKLSPQKMFEYMNSYDLACSVGGGENSKSVLEAAGLMFICNCVSESFNFKSHTCYKDRQRHKRDLNALVNSYKNRDRNCCQDGRRKGMTLQSCGDRLRHIKHQPASCQEAFKKCCDAATAKRKKDIVNRMRSGLGRTLSSGITDNEIDEVPVYLRSVFPQSWMWHILDADASGNARKIEAVPDSITTWEVQAVSISPTKGFCIADPQPLKVFQDFFISVKLPYSVKRNEQLEVKAVVFNYQQQKLQVTVKLKKVAGLCSAGTGDVVQQVTVEPQSATAVNFSVVPLIIGNIPITIEAYVSRKIHDKIQKELKVMGEGELVHLDMEYNIDAQNGKKIEFDILAPEDAVPGQESITRMSFKGGVMGEAVDNCLNLDGVNELIKLPTGCAEQTMIRMSPAIHAITYLDATNQWFSLKDERREEALTMIQAGYTRVLMYKKNDGSYGAFLKTPSSIWLTAFIAKELTRSRHIINVHEPHIQEAISYLISKQKADGSWVDPNPLYDRGMKGGVGHAEDDVPLTAFVLITLKHALLVYKQGTDKNLRLAIDNANRYLLAHFDAQQNHYAVAIAAYALSLDNHQSPEAKRAHEKLMSLATCDKERCFWDVGGKFGGLDQKADAISVETTAYGLLQALTMEDKQKSPQITNWLIKQRRYGGGFQSTQDTVVALEALSKFSIRNNDVDHLNLRVEMRMNKHSKNLHLNRQTALTQTSIEFNEVGRVVVNVYGQGKGTLSLVQTYRSLKMDQSFCDHLDLSVKVDRELTPLYDVEEEDTVGDYYDYGEDETRDEPMSRQDWSDLRTRKKRQAPEEPKKENTLYYSVCVSKKLGNSTGMVLVDISLLTGLVPNIQDLENSVKGTEKYIDHYDVQRNKVFLYFSEISYDKTCVRFRAEQMIPVGLVQPAVAAIYYYYNPNRKCSVSYTVSKDNPMLAKLCEADVCACAEGGCPQLKVTFSEEINENSRYHYACFSPSVDYVYIAKVMNSSNDGVFTSYSMLINKVHLADKGKDSAIRPGAVREMVKRVTCDGMKLKVDADYLIMGQKDTINLGNSETRFRYILDNKMWIEEMPSEMKCMATKNKQACQLLEAFIREFAQQQCRI